MVDPNDLPRYYAGLRPAGMYHPGRQFDFDGNPVPEIDNGQLQFHKAPHVYRLAAPGNGWGKTCMAAIEVDWWGFGDHPFQSMPKRPRVMIWCAQTFKQFNIYKNKLESWWPQSVRDSYHGSEFHYTWPDRTRLFIITSETDPKHIAGIEPDLIAIDEECERRLWIELQRRRRGQTFTRFIITATACYGLTWTHSDLYKPWKAFHDALNMDERQAMRAQLHEYDDPALKGQKQIWCWPRGSHKDNAVATPRSWAEQLRLTAGSAAEREVRLYGGFRDFGGEPVFSVENLEKMRAHLLPGRSGRIEVTK